MRININKPTRWIEVDKAKPNAYWYKDMEAFYNNLELVLKSRNIPYYFKNGSTVNSIHINHHSHGVKPNTWHIKKGYVPGYLYFDKTGYSGWSEGAANYNPEKVYPKELLDDTEDLIQYYIENNISKIKQPHAAIIPKEDYILVIGQKPGDTVERLARIKTQHLSILVNEAFKDSKYTVYTKPHPAARISYDSKTVEGSIHKLVSKASAIYTVNSGAGFESLFHNKRIFISGETDYSPVVDTISCIDSINRTKYLIEESPSTDARLHFLTYCFNEHFVNAYDIDSINKKVDRVVNDYNLGV